MGGNVNIVVRYTNGEIQSSVKHTSRLTDFFSHYLFYQKDLSFFQNFLSSNNEVPQLYPVDYGIIYIDLIQSKVISSQNYSNLNNILLNDLLLAFPKKITIKELSKQVSLMINSYNINKHNLNNFQELIIHLNFFFNNNLIRKVQHSFNQNVDIPNLKKISFINFIFILLNTKNISRIILNDSIFSFNLFYTDLKTTFKLKKILANNGLIYSNEDHFFWDKFLLNSLRNNY